MAKRKRLTPPQTDYLSAESESVSAASETKPIFPPAARAPIAHVAGEASASAALEEVVGEMARARAEGRLIQALPVAAVDAGYLVRDRIMADEDELKVLVESLRARGQQTPIEVAALGAGRYGLISGWRRLTALQRLHGETGAAQYSTVQAVLRRPETAADAYVAMVEENEIRVGLSYYERARVAAKAVEQGVYLSEKQALMALFGTASRARRSKIRSFLPIYRALDSTLRFPWAIPERLGLALGRALTEDGAAAARIRAALAAAAPSVAGEEMACLERALKPAQPRSLPAEFRRSEPAEPSKSPASAASSEPADTVLSPARNLYLVHRDSETDPQILLTGAAVTKALRDRLLDWLKTGQVEQDG